MIDEVLTTVAQPDAITPDPLAGRWRYWRGTSSPTRWIRVIVDWKEESPWIVTAFPTRRFEP